MSVELVRFAEAPSMPWKNGLGTTTQLAIHPRSTSLDSFAWRVSIARLSGSAAFSAFAGVERCLAMLRGEMTLLRAHVEPVRMTTASPPISFPGDEPAEGRVESGTALDLNLMYRSGRWDATMHRMVLVAGRTLKTQATTMLCALVAGCVSEDQHRYEMAPFDLLRADPNVELRADTAIDVYVMELRAHQP